MSPEALDLPKESGFRSGDIPFVESNASGRRKAGPDLRQRFAWVFRELEDRAGEGAARRQGRAEHDVKDGKRKEVLRFLGEIGNAVADSGVDHWFSGEAVGDRLAIPFEEELIDAIVLV